MDRNKFFKLPQDVAMRKDITGNDKVLLAIIVDYMGRNNSAWPSRRTLQHKAGLTGSTICESIKRLENAGLIIVERRESGKSNLYKISEEISPAKKVYRYEDYAESGMEIRPVRKSDRYENYAESGLKIIPPRKSDRYENRTGGCMEIIPEAVGKSYHIQTDLIEPDTPLPPKGEIGGGVVEFEFDKFWDIYPKHRDKEKAREAWRELDPNKHLISWILSSVGAMKLSAKWKEKNGQYIPSPEKWLRDERWKDVQDPEEKAKSPKGSTARPHIILKKKPEQILQERQANWRTLISQAEQGNRMVQRVIERLSKDNPDFREFMLHIKTETCG